MKVIKTWVNAWATSTRLHETNSLPCLFGCVGMRDDFAHYVECKVLNSLCKFLLESHPQDPLIAFGFLSPSVQHFKQLCCIFSGYHAMHRAAQADESVHQIRTSQSQHRRRLWSVFAEAVAAEARELSISVRQFSLLQFISCLIDEP